MSILLKRGTRSAIDDLANRGLLQVGEPLFITDESRFAVATSNSTYQSMLKQGEVSQLTQPILFSAYLNTIQNPGANNPLTAWTVLHNLGGGTYSSGAYTIPITGWYKLHISLLSDSSVAVNGGLCFRVNSTNRLRIAYSSHPVSYYEMTSSEEYVLLNAGDQVRVISLESTPWHGNASTPVGRWNIEYKYWNI